MVGLLEKGPYLDCEDVIWEEYDTAGSVTFACEVYLPCGTPIESNWC
jgi:hypothetical protein